MREGIEMRAQLLRRLKVLEQQQPVSDIEPMKLLPEWYQELWSQAGGRFDESGRAVWTDVGRMQGQQGLADDPASAGVANRGDTESEPSSTSPLRFD